mmetsp:Transcript_26263/g.55216  ORF Transcript_26263/g.55216 Transcript_26263/m.55216 type:complete len:85 (+) Transcript_26263:118-372(+)
MKTTSIFSDDLFFEGEHYCFGILNKSETRLIVPAYSTPCRLEQQQQSSSFILYCILVSLNESIQAKKENNLRRQFVPSLRTRNL